MSFQTTVRADQAFGVPGELYADGPTRAQPGIVKGTAANIVVGRAFTIDTADGQFQPGSDGGVFGGILGFPKSLAGYGTAGNPLGATLQVPAGTACQFITMGMVIVQLANASTIGQGVYYDDVTGVLSAGTASTGQTQIANAQVVRTTNAAASLAVISLTGA